MIKYWTERFAATSDYISTFSASLLIQGLGVITGVLTARLLGPVGKGELATVFWLPGLMTVAGIMGLPQASAFLVSRSPDRQRDLTSAGFLLAFCLGALAAAILYPLMPLILGPDKQSLVGVSRLFLLYLPIVYSSLTLLGIDQGRQAFGQYNILRLLPAVLYVAGILALWWIDAISVAAVVTAYLIVQGIAWLIRAGAARRSLLPHSSDSWRATVCEIGKQGLQFHLPALAGIILMRLDIFILIRMESAEQIGFYSVALSMALMQISVATTLVQVSFPKIARQSSPQEAAEAIARQFRISQPLILGMAVATLALTPLLVWFLFGRSYLPAIVPALILAMAYAIWGLNQVLDNGIRGMGSFKPGVVANGLGIIIILIFGIILTYLYGIIGMAVAMLLSQMWVLILLVYSLVVHKSSVPLRALWGMNRGTVRTLLSILSFRNPSVVVSK